MHLPQLQLTQEFEKEINLDKMRMELASNVSMVGIRVGTAQLLA